MNAKQRAELKAKLLADRDELRACLLSGADATKPVELDQASVGRLSRMDAMQGQAMAIESRRRQQLQLRRIEASLNRIEDPDFGLCADCDEAIDSRRLRLNPSVTLCISCAAARERNQG